MGLDLLHSFESDVTFRLGVCVGGVGFLACSFFIEEWILGLVVLGCSS